MPTFVLSNGPHGTREVFEYLRLCARHMYTDNYEHICDEVERASRGTVRIAPIGVGNHLGVIRSECIAHQVPWINALAVGLNRNTAHPWRPSDGFLPSSSNWDPSFELLWRGMVLQVFSYDWSQVVVT